MKRNLVLGSEGFVGRPFCDFLRGRGEEVVPFDVKRSQAEDGRTAKLPLDGVDRVWFLAWDVGGAKYLYRKETQLHQLHWNMDLLRNVIPQLEGRPFLFVSSQLAAETHTVYGSTKTLGEVWARLAGGVRVRLWNVYGPLEEPSERSHVVADFVYQAVNDGVIRMMTTGEEERQFIHIDDVSRAFYAALTGGLETVADVTTGEWVRVRDMAEIIAARAGAKVEPGKVVGRTVRTPIQGNIPGWKPKVPLKDGLERMVDNLRGA